MLLLGGCTLFGPDRNTPEAQCEAAAYDDPTVKEIILQRNSGNQDAFVQLLPNQRDAVKRATQRCLRQKGLAPPGGVEPVQPPK